MKSPAPHILLVNPWIHDFAAYDFWAKPLGLLGLAAILRDAGCRVSYLDCLNRFHPRAEKSDPSARYGRGPYQKTEIAKPPGLEDVDRRFSRYGIPLDWFRADLSRLDPPDLVMVTSLMTYWYPGVRETIRILREILPEIRIILGGVYATLCTDHAQEVSGADVVVPGAGENAILELVKNHTGFIGRVPLDIHDFDTYPFPALDLQHRINYAPLSTVRGCPFDCAYCASKVLEPKLMRKSPQRVMEEIRHWHLNHRVFDFALYDDAFLVDADSHAVPILEAVVRSGLGLRFHTPNAVHVRGITGETASLMYRAGFKTLRLGLETAHFDERGDLDRKVVAEEFQKAVAHLKDVGFKKDQVGAYLLTGLPDQPVEAVAESIRIVKESGITPIPAYYSPIPHTRLWERAVAASRYNLESDPVFTNNAIFPCSKEPFSWNTLSRLKQLAVE